MKSSKELAKEIAELLGNPDFALTEKVAELLQAQEDCIKPKCNQCGNIIEEEGKDRRGSLSVNLSWGYSSTAKDGDRDTWSLCKACTDFVINKYHLICVVCKKTIPEVMADLDARNPHCTDYGNYEEAYQRQTNSPFGQSYALLNDRIVCEWCYDAITAQFKIPIPDTRYMVGSGDLYSGDGVHLNRTQEGLKPRTGDWGDFCRHMYEAYVRYEDAVAIRKSEHSYKLAIGGIVNIYRDEYREKKIKGGRDSEVVDSIWVLAGNGQHYDIPLSWIEGVANNSSSDARAEIPKIDFTKPAILEQGKILALGSYQIEFRYLFQEKFKPTKE